MKRIAIAIALALADSGTDATAAPVPPSDTAAASHADAVKQANRALTGPSKSRVGVENGVPIMRET